MISFQRKIIAASFSVLLPAGGSRAADTKLPVLYLDPNQPVDTRAADLILRLTTASH